MSEPTNEYFYAASQLRHELMNAVLRYGRESDVTVYQAIGALEAVKADLIDMLDGKRHLEEGR